MEDKAVISLSVLQNSLFSIFCTRLWSVRTAVLFRYKGRLVTSQQKKNFRLRFIFAGRLVLNLYAWAVENSEIRAVIIIVIQNINE